jgi:hypothetical protein
MRGEEVAGYFNVPSQHSPEKMDKNHERSQSGKLVLQLRLELGTHNIKIKHLTSPYPYAS